MREKIKNGGYTMVELIIVIAIIAVMSGMGFLTIVSIRTSQANSSMQRFDEELSALVMRTKSQSADCAIKIEKADANYNIYYGTCTDGDPTTFTTTSTQPDAVLQRVTIYYDSSYNADGVTTPLTSQIIQIRKSDSQVLAGYGEYVFAKYDRGNTVGRVTLNQYTGSHTYGKN
jgi:prepilin-type N-terminal cleavage/methylation domain-containing protein